MYLSLKGFGELRDQCGKFILGVALYLPNQVECGASLHRLQALKKSPGKPLRVPPAIKVHDGDFWQDALLDFGVCAALSYSYGSPF